MNLLIEIVLDRMVLLDARKNALTFKKIETKSIDDDIVFICQLKNKHTDYLNVLSPNNNFDTNENGINIWDWSNIKIKEDLNFSTNLRKGQNPKAKVLDKHKIENYSVLMIRPNSTIELHIILPKAKKTRNIKFELGFRIKKLNSKVYLKSFKV